MWSVLFHVEIEHKDTLTADLWEAGTKGIIEEPGGLRAFFDEPIDRGVLKHGIIDIRAEDAFWQAHQAEGPIDPIFVGERFFITPSVYSGAVPPDRFHLAIDAATAFGSGRHESTQLMMEALEACLRNGDLVLDVGCGSGILSRAAALLGAGAVFSCDIDEQAVFNARKHLASPIFLGSADTVRDGLADIVLVNISARIIDHLAEDLKRVTRPDGLLILSGFLEENTPQRFRPVQTRERGGWACWHCRPEDILAADENSGDPNVHPADWWS